MAVKKIAYDQEARERMRDGVKQLARAVKVTLGPRGRNGRRERWHPCLSPLPRLPIAAGLT